MDLHFSCSKKLNFGGNFPRKNQKRKTQKSYHDIISSAVIIIFLFFLALRYCILFLAVKSLDFYYFIPLIEKKKLI